MTSGNRMGGCVSTHIEKESSIERWGGWELTRVTTHFPSNQNIWVSVEGNVGWHSLPNHSVGRHGLMICVISDWVYDFDNCPLWSAKKFPLYFFNSQREEGEETEGECCFFKREGERVSEREREREREGPLCPPETRKGIELICCCLVSAYGALSCTTVRGRGGEERAELTHNKLHHGHRRWAKRHPAIPSLSALGLSTRGEQGRGGEERGRNEGGGQKGE